MPRLTKTSVACDTGHFTPMQLQARSVLTLGFNALSQWVRDNLVSHRFLVTKYNVGFVVWGLHVEHREKVTYFDADALDFHATARLLNEGTQLDFAIEIYGGERHAASLRCVLAALWIDEAEELSGLAGKVEGEALKLFQPDELALGESYDSPVPAAVADLERRGQLVCAYDHPFTIYRHNCEVADQWFFAEVPRFIAESREHLVKREPERPLLRRGLSAPLAKLDILYLKPFYLLDEAFVRTRVLLVDDKLRYVHRLTLQASPDVSHAVIIESY